MKELLILRHAKSSWSNPSLADIDRPLNKRGKRDAPRMGALLREQDLVPDIILCSPAVRAKKTAQAVTDESGFQGEIQIHDDFYPGDPSDYIEVLAANPDHVSRAMVVGHNPGLEELLDELTGEYARLPTSALAQIALPIGNWIELNQYPLGSLINLWRVKELD